MEQTPLEKRDDALSFLVAYETGVLATLSADGTPRARLIYYTCDDDFNVYFITLANTRKVAARGVRGSSTKHSTHYSNGRYRF